MEKKFQRFPTCMAVFTCTHAVFSLVQFLHLCSFCTYAVFARMQSLHNAVLAGMFLLPNSRIKTVTTAQASLNLFSSQLNCKI